MHKAWPRLVKRMDQGKHSTGQEDIDLITATRTWFCLYLFEHQYVPTFILLDIC